MAYKKTIEKVKKRLKKINICFSKDYFQTRDKIECLDDTLGKLKKSQRDLEDKIGKASGNKRKELEGQLGVVKAQRHKGLKLLKELRAELRK